MRVKDIKPGMENITITVKVKSVGEPRKVETKYGEALVARAVVEDESGEVILNLWRDQINIVKQGYVIRLENAFAKEYKGRVELNVGRQGKIVVVKKSD